MPELKDPLSLDHISLEQNIILDLAEMREEKTEEAERRWEKRKNEKWEGKKKKSPESLLPWDFGCL